MSDDIQMNCKAFCRLLMKNEVCDMRFSRKIRRRLFPGKQQPNKDTERIEIWESAQRCYLERFEKDVRLQKLYPQSYLQLQKVVSEEEWRV